MIIVVTLLVFVSVISYVIGRITFRNKHISKLNEILYNLNGCDGLTPHDNWRLKLARDIILKEISSCPTI